MRPRADDTSLDRVRTGTPQSTAARSSWALVSESSVVAHLAQSLDQHLRACLLSLRGAGGCRHGWGGPGEKGSRQQCERGGGGRGKRQVVGSGVVSRGRFVPKSRREA